MPFCSVFDVNESDGVMFEPRPGARHETTQDFPVAKHAAEEKITAAAEGERKQAKWLSQIAADGVVAVVTFRKCASINKQESTQNKCR